MTVHNNKYMYVYETALLLPHSSSWSTTAIKYLPRLRIHLSIWLDYASGRNIKFFSVETYPSRAIMKLDQVI
jgi:hypothetical protein